MMDTQSLINLLFCGFGGLGGFILRATWTALETMRKDLQGMQSSMSATYVRRDDFKDAIEDFKSVLNRIEDKLDDKADR
jgi:hypothetical protein